jgi:hypothetical protein
MVDPAPLAVEIYDSQSDSDKDSDEAIHEGEEMMMADAAGQVQGRLRFFSSRRQVRNSILFLIKESDDLTID